MSCEAAASCIGGVPDAVDVVASGFVVAACGVVAVRDVVAASHVRMGRRCMRLGSIVMTFCVVL